MTPGEREAVLKNLTDSREKLHRWEPASRASNGIIALSRAAGQSPNAWSTSRPWKGAY